MCERQFQTSDGVIVEGGEGHQSSAEQNSHRVPADIYLQPLSCDRNFTIQIYFVKKMSVKYFENGVRVSLRCRTTFRDDYQS